MPDEQTPSPAAEAAQAPPAAAPAQPASGGIPHEWRMAFADDSDDAPDAVQDASPAVSNEQDAPPAPAAASATDAEPAPDEPSEGVSASAAPEPGTEPESPEKPLSRREQERLDHEKQIADLRAQLAERDPARLKEALREEILAEEAQRAASSQSIEEARANAERFARLKDTPDAELTGEDYAWREEQKELRARYPEAERAIRADAERIIQEGLATADRMVADGWQGIQADLDRQITASANLPHVDKAAFKQPGVTWKDMAEQIHAAGAAWKEAELSDRVTKAEAEAAQLRKDNEALRAEALRDKRAPANVGRSASSSVPSDVFDPSLGWQGNLAGAFATNGTG